MTKDEKKIRLRGWDDTPPTKRRPRFQSQLAKELGVTSATLNTWRKKREAQKKVVIPLEGQHTPEGIGDYDSDEWLRNSTPEADKALVEAVKKGSPGAQKIFYQLIDRLREKSDREAEHKLDGSTIAPAVLDALEELDRQGVVKLQIQPNPLPDKLCITSGQGKEENNKV